MSEAHKGFKHSDDAKRKISIGNKNKYVSKETRLKLSVAAKKRDKWKHSEESKEKMSLSARGRNNHMFGKHHSQETKDRMSKSSKGQKAWNKGVLHTNETRSKMIVAAKIKKLNNMHKLNWEIVKEIRKKYDITKQTYNDIACKYRVTPGMIGHIIRNRMWVDDNYIVPITKKSKLSQQDVDDIKRLHDEKRSYKKIGEIYDVCRSTVYEVIKGRYKVIR